LPDSALFRVDSPPTEYAFGLYRGEQIELAAHLVYNRLLSERLRPALTSWLDERLRSGKGQKFEYEATRAYVMLHDPGQLAPDSFAAHIGAVWEFDHPGAGLEREALAHHARALAAVPVSAVAAPLGDVLPRKTNDRPAGASDAAAGHTPAQTEPVSDAELAKVGASCRQSVEGRYPFARSGQDIAIADFTRMFAPGGEMDSFFATRLASGVDTSTHPWRPRGESAEKAGMAQMLNAFERASGIRGAFFAAGSDAPRMTVTVKPLVMDASIAVLTLEVGGKTLSYRHGPQLADTIEWPGDGNGRVILTAQVAAGEPTNVVVIENIGPWALHRLFDEAEIVPGSTPERFQAIFDLTGKKAAFEIVAPGGAGNPLFLPELRGFTCPAS